MSSEVDEWLKNNKVTKLRTGYAKGCKINGSICGGSFTKGLSRSYFFNKDIKGFESLKLQGRSHSMRVNKIISGLKGRCTETQKNFMIKNNIKFKPSMSKKRAFRKIARFKRSLHQAKSVIKG